MWWVGKREAATVYLGQDEVRLAVGDTRRVVARGLPFEQCLTALDEALAGLSPVPLKVRLSAAWSQPFLLPPVHGVSSEAEWLRVAEGLVEDLTGFPAGSRLRLDTAQHSPRLVVALHGTAMAAIDALAQRHRVTEVRPWWVGVLAQAVPPDTDAKPDPAATQGLAVVDSDALTLLVAEGDRYAVAQSMLLLGEDPAAILARALISQGHRLEDVQVRRIVAATVHSDLAPSSAPEAVPFLEAAA